MFMLLLQLMLTVILMLIIVLMSMLMLIAHIYACYSGAYMNQIGPIANDLADISCQLLLLLMLILLQMRHADADVPHSC